MTLVPYDRHKAQAEAVAGESLDERAQAKKAEDEDFAALHRLINGTKITGDADVQELRKLVADHNRRRLHQALDRVLDRFSQKRCAGDRFSRLRIQ